MQTSLMTAPAVRFHMSLNVSDLTRSVAFYRTLFNVEPAKLRPDYAKFEPDDPPLVVSLEPSVRPTGGPLNHLGFRLADAKSLVAMQERLERAGIRSQREEGVECCYAKQTKFWVTDPDNTLWEVYTFEGDLDHRGVGQTLDEMVPMAKATASASVVWDHTLGRPVPAILPLSDASADEVRLLGTFNVPLDADVRSRLLQEVARVLKPGGRVYVHVLTTDRPLVGLPALPGPAAAVQYVPLPSEPVADLEAAGFERVRLLKYDAKPCFRAAGSEMRETQIEAWKGRAGEGHLQALYKGPFREVTLDGGLVLPRGAWVRVSRAVADGIAGAAMADQIVVVADR